jgi:hypothetical protein
VATPAASPPAASPTPTRPQPADVRPPPAGTSTTPSTPAQSVRPTSTPAERGGANPNAAPSGTSGGKVNLDGSTSGSGGGAASPEPGASAPLNLDLHGGGFGPGLNRSRSGLVPLVPGPPDDTKNKLGKEIDKASRADCKDAYASAGILAVLPLAKDAATGKGCKW